MAPLIQAFTFMRALHFSVTAECTEGALGRDGKPLPGCELGLPNVAAGHDQVQQILSIAFATIAALAVVVIVIAGFRFIIAQGNPQETAKARNTIIYALVGLIVALAAEAIVALVLGKAAK